MLSNLTVVSKSPHWQPKNPPEETEKLLMPEMINELADMWPGDQNFSEVENSDM